MRRLEPVAAVAERPWRTSGARLVPPMPMTTAVSKPASRIASPKPSSAAICSAKWSGASSQPSRSAMAASTSRIVRPERRVAVEQPLGPALVAGALDALVGRRELGPEAQSEARPRGRSSVMAPGTSCVAGRSPGRRPRLDREDLVEPAAVAGLAAEPCAEERQRALERRLDPDDPRAEGQDVHVVVLDALVGRVGVVADRRAHAADLVRGDARADAGAADRGCRGPPRPSGSRRPRRSAKSG